jgi:hypothetical protein
MSPADAAAVMQAFWIYALVYGPILFVVMVLFSRGRVEWTIRDLMYGGFCCLTPVLNILTTLVCLMTLWDVFVGPHCDKVVFPKAPKKSP